MKPKATVWAGVAIAGPIPGISRSSSAGKSTSISGWVIDSSCAYTKGLEKPISVPSSQNAKVPSFAGEHVKVSGTAYAHGDSHGIVIASIAPDRR